MNVIPKKNATKDMFAQCDRKMIEFKQKLDAARETNKKIAFYEKKVREYEDKKAECRVLLNRGESKFETTGNLMKGGALFINAAKYYLKKYSRRERPDRVEGRKIINRT